MSAASDSALRAAAQAAADMLIRCDFDPNAMVLRNLIAALASPSSQDGEMKPQTDQSEFADVLAEIERAVRKFPTWPTDPFHALAVLGEEFGELTKAVLQTVYEPGKADTNDIRMEAVQTAAMALRFIASLDAYQYDRCPQHTQSALASPQSQEQSNG